MIKVYLDNCCYNRPFDDLSQETIREEAVAKLYIQHLIDFGTLLLYYSFVSLAEIIDSPHIDNRNSILNFIDKANAVFVSDESVDKIGNTARIIMDSGIKDKDARHIACAIYSNCDYFLTTDKRLLKYKTNQIKIVNPVVFVESWRERNG